MWQKLWILTTALIPMLPGIAYSGVYVGGGAGVVQYDYQDVNESKQKKFILGYRFYNEKDNSFSTELEYSDFGDADVEWFGRDVYLHMQGINVSFVYGIVSPKNYSFTNLKAGVYNIGTEFNDRADGSSKTENSTGFSAGLAFGGYMYNRKLALYGELQNYFGVKDFQKNNSVLTHTLNIVYYFD